MHDVYVAGVAQLLDNTMMVFLYHGFKEWYLYDTLSSLSKKYNGINMVVF